MRRVRKKITAYNNLLAYFSADSNDQKIYKFIEAIVKLYHNNNKSDFIKQVIFKYLQDQGYGKSKEITRDDGENIEAFVININEKKFYDIIKLAQTFPNHLKNVENLLSFIDHQKTTDLLEEIKKWSGNIIPRPELLISFLLKIWWYTGSDEICFGHLGKKFSSNSDKWYAQSEWIEEKDKCHCGFYYDLYQNSNSTNKKPRVYVGIFWDKDFTKLGFIIENISLTYNDILSITYPEWYCLYDLKDVNHNKLLFCREEINEILDAREFATCILSTLLKLNTDKTENTYHI